MTQTLLLKNNSTFLHNFNPTLKLLCCIFLITMTFIPVSFIFQLGILVFVVCLWSSAKLPFKKLKPILFTILILFFFIFLINWLVNKNPGVKFDLESHYQLWGDKWNETMSNIFKYNKYYWTHGYLWGGTISNILSTDKPTGNYVLIKINGQKLYLAYKATWYALSSYVVITTLSIVLKIFVMLMVFSLLVNTTSTLQLSDAFYHILWPLKWIKVPAAEISYIISISVSFIPNLYAEANKLVKAQTSKGLDFKNGKLIEKIKCMKSLVIPMFSTTFVKADKIADAMEAKNFNPSAKRTKYKQYKCSISNWILLIILILILALFIYLSISKVIIYPFVSIDCFNI